MKKKALCWIAAFMFIILSSCQESSDGDIITEDSIFTFTTDVSETSADESGTIEETKNDLATDESFFDNITAPKEITEIPIIRISTDDGKNIVSKSEYKSAIMDIQASESSGLSDFECSRIGLSIKGRGNASWNQFPKKGYRIKLTESTSLLGMKKDKDWVLVSSYGDKTLLRNIIAHEMAKSLSHLEFTPTHTLVELYLNDEYLGVYTLAEKIEFGGGKLEYTADENSSDTPFLLEVGWDYNDEMVYGKNFFDIDYIDRIVFKEPEFSSKYTPCAKSIIKYMEQAENAIVNLDGYEEYIDVDSLIDYLIITEFTNNTESVFYRSVYMYKPQNGKLKFGPVWDFDMAFGNHKDDISDYDGWCSVDNDFYYLGHNGVSWYSFLFEDEVFVEKFKNRWQRVSESLLQIAMQTLDTQYNAVYDAQKRNFERWDIMNKKVGVGNVDHHTYNTYELQVEYLKNFIQNRYDWINEHISEL